MKSSWKFAAMALLMMGCAVNSDQPSYTLSYESFECLGNCPVYKVQIDNLRNLTFEGIKNSKEGLSSDKLAKNEYNSLMSIVDALVKDSPSEGLQIGVMDSGGKELRVMDGGEKKVFAVGNNKPRTIKLDSMMNQILLSRGLIGS